MGTLIDSCILIECERGRLDLDALAAAKAPTGCFLSVVTVSELLHGVHRAKAAATRERRLAFVEHMLASFPILPITVATARAHARIWVELQARGRTIGCHDLCLAATCIAHGHSIATSNVREFERVQGLVIENWADLG